MSLITLIIVIAVIGLIVWLVTTYIPMPEPFKKIIIVVALIVVVLYCLSAFGILGDVSLPIRGHR